MPPLPHPNPFVPLGLRPMLAHNKPWTLSDLRFPLLASPKLDGIRALIVLTPSNSCEVLSRSLKRIPNAFVQKTLAPSSFHGLDGELIVGPPTDPLCLLTTKSGVSRYAGSPDFTFWVFDRWNRASLSFSNILSSFTHIDADPIYTSCHIKTVPQRYITSLAALLDYEAEILSEGFEGLILRSPDSPYKWGRSTFREGFMLKLKRFEDSEAKIVAVHPAYHNANPPIINALGLQERAAVLDNKTPLPTLGSFECTSPDFPETFRVSPGPLTAAQRKSLWEKRASLLGQTITFKYFAQSGLKDRPREPRFKSFRASFDQ